MVQQAQNYKDIFWILTEIYLLFFRILPVVLRYPYMELENDDIIVYMFTTQPEQKIVSLPMLDIKPKPR